MKRLSKITKSQDLNALQGESYVEANALWRGISNQKSGMLQWMSDALPKHSTDPYSILSVGCGGGLFDFSFLDLVHRRFDRLSYVGLEPDAEALEIFKKGTVGFESHKPIQFESHLGTLESFETTKRFDLIHFVHIFYFVEKFEQHLEKALKWLKPGGRLMVLSSPSNGLNKPFDHFQELISGRPIVFSEDIKNSLTKLNLSYESHRVPGRLQIGDHWNNHEDRLRILSFLTHLDLKNSSPEFVSGIQEFAEDLFIDEGSETYLDHPVDGITVELS